MIRTLYCCALFTILLSTTSFQRQKPEKILKKAGYVYVPGGATPMDGSEVTVRGFYMSLAEITNAQYREFLDSLQARGNTDALNIANVQSWKWHLPNSQMDAFEQHYFTHEAYKNYPVVNITQEGARLYCAWLEEKLHAAGIQAKVRLPEKAEWIIAARGGHAGNIYAWEGKALRNKRGAYLANFKTENQADDGGYVTTISRSYRPNAYGLYNMCGNVSEWLSTDGACIGGNWRSEPQFLLIDAPPEFPVSSDASPFIGFRPVISLP